MGKSEAVRKLRHCTQLDFCLGHFAGKEIKRIFKVTKVVKRDLKIKWIAIGNDSEDREKYGDTEQKQCNCITKILSVLGEMEPTNQANYNLQQITGIKE